MASVATFSFVLHVFVELPACLNFLLAPDDQLPLSAPQAHAVIRQYAVLLFSSVLISVMFALRDQDIMTGKVAGALALYHIAPCIRAWSRIRGEVPKAQPRSFIKDPVLHLFLHSLCLGSLSLTCWSLYMSNLAPLS